MLGLKFRIEGLYFASFRKPTTTAVALTYPLPPFTTIRGLIANALGLPRDSFEIQEWFKIGIKPEKAPRTNREMVKLLKFIKRGKETHYLRTFPSSPMHREFLVNPSYTVYLIGNDSRIEWVYNALISPKRPLYLGTSDDLVDLDVFEPIRIEKIQSNEVHSILDGVHEGCIIENIPYRFVPVKDRKGNLKEVHLEYKLVSIPRAFPYVVKESTEAWDFEGESVRVI
ncbi:MAG TPA: CRISPR-associated protein Cas5 [Thermococcus litoralis]|uniref:CRISPR-associated protein Cas5 n=1 Tax=Thermococcus litoralis TaxID=2265 RepID=A0A7C5P9C3_THELI|nr:CRISPR-associated protein Cas5 [Thermococcus litoralis]